VLDAFGEQLLAVLRRREEVYHTLLDMHFQRHLSPFVGG
jgi:hypothetical protein